MKKVFTYMLIPKKSVGFPPWLSGMCLFLFTSFLVHAHERVSHMVKDENIQALSMVSGLAKSSDVTTDVDERHLTYIIIIENELNQI